MLTQLVISAVNLDVSSPTPSLKVLDSVEANSVALHLPPEEGINQVGDSNKVINSNSCQ